MRHKWLSLLFACLFTCVFLLTTIPCPVKGEVPPLTVTAESAILMDADTGQVLYEKNADKRLAPASMTKLMTLILAVEALEKNRVKLGEKVVASENAWRMGGSQIYLEPGEEMTFQDMLIAVAVGSANDACVAIAEHLAGSHENFVEQMNRKARELGLKNTHFANAYGLPAENHYSSARDMALLGRYALRYPKLMEFTSIKEYSLRNGEFKLFNTNKLLWWYKGTDGFKTGWTNEAKYCLVSTVERNGLRLVATVMGCPEPRGNFRDSMTLYNYGFANYSYKSFFKRGSIVGVVKVGKGVRDSVEVQASENIGIIVPKGEEDQITYRKMLVDYVNAPVKEGQVLGKAYIYRNKKLVRKVDLTANAGVPRASVWDEIRRMWREIFIL